MPRRLQMTRRSKFFRRTIYKVCFNPSYFVFVYSLVSNSFGPMTPFLKVNDVTAAVAVVAAVWRCCCFDAETRISVYRISFISANFVICCLNSIFASHKFKYE